MQRHEVLLARVAVARGGSALPADKALRPGALRKRAGAGFDEPLLEGVVGRVRRRAALPGEGGHVVKRKARADDQDVTVRERAKRPAQGDMRGRVEAADQRKLYGGDVGARIHQHQRDEHAVVDAAPRIDARRNAALPEHLDDRIGEPGAAGRGIVDPVGLVRKAVVVEEHGRPRRAQQRRRVLLPVGAHHQDGLRRGEPRGKRSHELDHGPVAGVAQYGQRPAAVREVDDLRVVFVAGTVYHGRNLRCAGVERRAGGGSIAPTGGESKNFFKR